MCAKLQRAALLQSWRPCCSVSRRRAFTAPRTVYLSGGRMEVEHFCRILAYSPDRLCLQMPHGRLTIYGDGLKDRHPYRQPPDPGAVRATDFADD